MKLKFHILDVFTQDGKQMTGNQLLVLEDQVFYSSNTNGNTLSALITFFAVN